MCICQLVFHDFDNISSQQECTFDYFFILGVETDGNDIVNLVQIQFNLTPVALVGQHQQSEC